jgi:hypothetical protein
MASPGLMTELLLIDRFTFPHILHLVLSREREQIK